MLGVVSAGLVRVLLVNVCVASINVTTPLALGNCMCRSADGSTAVSRVSLPSAVTPSNTTALSSKVICVVKALSDTPPRILYISVKLAFILVPAVRRVSPLPSLAEAPIPIVCFAIF